jgi:hypothetical protein
MFNEVNKIEEMMVDFCEYNPMIFAQKTAFSEERDEKRETFSLADYLRGFARN